MPDSVRNLLAQKDSDAPLRRQALAALGQTAAAEQEFARAKALTVAP